MVTSFNAQAIRTAGMDQGRDRAGGKRQLERTRSGYHARRWPCL